jgi:hypothetical protein
LAAGDRDLHVLGSRAAQVVVQRDRHAAGRHCRQKQEERVERGEEWVGRGNTKERRKKWLIEVERARRREGESERDIKKRAKGRKGEREQERERGRDRERQREGERQREREQTERERDAAAQHNEQEVVWGQTLSLM